MKEYLDLVRDVLDNGRRKPDRTGTGTRSVFGRQVRFDLSKGFPILTTKKIHWRSVVAELLWFLSGDTNSKTLEDQGVTIWKEWAAPGGELGPIYGAQWRRFGKSDWERGFDQISELIEKVDVDPFSRRHVVSAWNPEDLPIVGRSPQENAINGYMALAPCHVLFQVIVEPFGPNEINWYKPALQSPPLVGRLSLSMYQRSADLFLGVPFNIASYALLTHMIAQQVNCVPGDLVISFGDLHLYENHLHPDIVFAQLARDPQRLPKLELRKAESIFDYKMEDCVLVGYRSWGAISAPIAV